MNTITRWDQSRGLTSLQDQFNRLLEGNFTRDGSGHAAWQPGRHQWTYTKPRTNWS
jgi:hypothetical protein